MRRLLFWRETVRAFDQAFGPGAWVTELVGMLCSCVLFAALLCLVAAIGESL